MVFGKEVSLLNDTPLCNLMVNNDYSPKLKHNNSLYKSCTNPFFIPLRTD